MIKRSFFALSKPKLTYDLLGSDQKAPEAIPVPGSLTLLLPETIDSTKQALITQGDAVKKGEKLKLYEDGTDYVLSPVAGTIRGFDSYSDDFGNTATYILIKPDPSKTGEEDTVGLEPEEDLDFANANLRHLPGALPFATLADENTSINTVIIAGADTDVLSDTCQFVCTAYADEMVEGTRILKRMTQVSRIFLTLPEKLQTQANFGSVQILKTDETYPSTLPAMIMKDHLGTELPAGKTPEDMGVCFIRAEALVSLARVFKTKAPVFEKVVTLIDKGGNKQRLTATLGTPLSKIFARFNVHINDSDRIIIGGPMRGFATYTPHHPVVPDMDMIIVQDRDTVTELSNTPCVNCGECIRICPANIPVNLLVRFLEADEYEEAADKYDLQSCIECGLCAFVCKARIPLYQYIRLGKHELLALRADA
ncbi:MAG TPA: electron transport complex protein RnfC [Desulfobacteraceae bacterium]|nr:electron transport complex protein RnfC [Desulfobacteraceae bacterium]